MKDTRIQIPHWVWLTSQFVWQIQQSLEQDPNQSIGNLFTSFLKSQSITDPSLFSLKNQGTVLMLMYGLVVVPKEIWGAEVLDKSFPFTTKTEFKIVQPEHGLSNSQLIKSLRNAIAHANFAIYSGMDQCVFWNMNKNVQRNFETVVSWQGIGRFLTEVGTHYLNNVINQDDNKGW